MSREKIGNINPLKKIENSLTTQQSSNIDEVFKDSPEVATMFKNNKELYQEYLDSVFPNSKIKDICYHGSPFKEIEKFLSQQDEQYIKHENTTTGKEIVVLNTDKIHILGYKQDIEKAKEWLKNKQ